jgi:tripartite-type tricarboxylate transporter receptor subunit TctC
MRYILACVALIATFLGFRSVALATDRPLTIVVAYSPGGSTDTMARLLGARLQEKLGRPIVIDARPGASGQIGTRFVARSAPDGNTIQITVQTTHAVVPALYRDPGYDPVKDFTPITRLALGPTGVGGAPVISAHKSRRDDLLPERAP